MVLPLHLLHNLTIGLLDFIHFFMHQFDMLGATMLEEFFLMDSLLDLPALRGHWGRHEVKLWVIKGIDIGNPFHDLSLQFFTPLLLELLQEQLAVQLGVGDRARTLQAANMTKISVRASDAARIGTWVEESKIISVVCLIYYFPVMYTTTQCGMDST